MKTNDTISVHTYDFVSDNASDFSACPKPDRFWFNGSFSNSNNGASFWSATAPHILNACTVFCVLNEYEIVKIDVMHKKHGEPIRCIKD